MGWKAELLETLKGVLTEENTDKVLEFIDEKIDVPGVPDEIVFQVLDAMMPKLLIEALEAILTEEDDDGAGS